MDWLLSTTDSQDSQIQALQHQTQLNLQAYNIIQELKYKKICSICLAPMTKPISTTNCNHQFCYVCIRNWIQKSRQCPQCRSSVSKLAIRQISLVKLRKQSADRVQQQIKNLVLKYRKNWIKKQGFYQQEITSKVKKLPHNQFQYEHIRCMVCRGLHAEESLLICDECDQRACHVECDLRLQGKWPEGEWVCAVCCDQ